MGLMKNFWHYMGEFVNARIEHAGVEGFQSIYVDSVTKGRTFVKFKIDVEAIIRKNPNKKYVLLYADVKNFKYINDVYGFEMGNKILKHISDGLEMENEILVHARVNADNFVAIAEYENESEIIVTCERFVHEMSNVSHVVGETQTISTFVGAYCTNGENNKMSIDAMLDRANMAQRRIKANHSSSCLLYDETFRQNMLAEQEMENKMYVALENGEFIVYLQPKFDIKEDKIAAAEALVRWQDPDKGLIPPMNFIPLFERNGFIMQLDTYMLEQACKILRRWIDCGKHPIPISVNVSKVQLTNPNFIEEYVELKEYYKIPNGLVEIEFTESMLFDNNERMCEVLKQFKKHGFKSSIDDFGSGYSSLNILKNLPADILKLDKQFFDEDEYQDREKVIITNIISMAKGLSMQTVAEGVEHMDQVEFLKSVNCEMVQGYVFDKPMPVKDFENKYIKK